MIEFFHFKKDIPFMSYGKITTAISLGTFILAVAFLLIKGLNMSIEFTGGTVIEVRYPHAVSIDEVRTTVEALNLGGKHKDIQVQALGTTQDIMIRLPNVPGATSASTSDLAFASLIQKGAEPAECTAPRAANAELAKAQKAGLRINEQERPLPVGKCIERRKVDFVGPSVGDELFSHGLIALIIVSLGIMGYLALRFEWRFAASAIIANMHDVVIILGFFALFQWEFSLTVLAAVLAVLGYSVNESVVVFDRIRENFRSGKLRGRSVPEVIDNAITTTMSRTLITHGCTEMMVLSMLFIGGSALHYFALALTIGIVFGIYSSVLVASPLLLLFGVTRENMIKQVRTKEEAVV